MGADIGGGDEGLGSEVSVDSDADLRTFSLSESAVSGVSIFLGTRSGDLRCFSKNFQTGISTINFQNDVGRVFLYSVSESVTDDVRSALSRARSLSFEVGVVVDGILFIFEKSRLQCIQSNRVTEIWGLLLDSSRFWPAGDRESWNLVALTAGLTKLVTKMGDALVRV